LTPYTSNVKNDQLHTMSQPEKHFAHKSWLKGDIILKNWKASLSKSGATT